MTTSPGGAKTAVLIRSALIVTGLVMYAFIATHLVNLILGL